MSGGPDAMSAALVPGLIRLVDPSSISVNGAKNWPSPPLSPTVGDCGPIWTSVNGGGLGRRGELEGDTAAAAVAAIFLETEIVAGALRREGGRLEQWGDCRVKERIMTVWKATGVVQVAELVVVFGRLVEQIKVHLFVGALAPENGALWTRHPSLLYVRNDRHHKGVVITQPQSNTFKL